jgi:hypothetical protein
MSAAGEQDRRGQVASQSAAQYRPAPPKITQNCAFSPVVNHRFYELCRNQPHIVALVTQRRADEMRARAGFDPNQRTWQAGGVGQQLLAGDSS